MCLGSSPKAPTPPPAVPEAPRTPDTSRSSGKSLRDKKKRVARSTILTSPQGVTDGANTTTKTLLGQ